VNATKEQVAAALNTVAALAEAIRGLGSVPSGVLYAHVMSHMSLAGYESAIGVLKRAGLVSEENFLLTWCGPQPDPAKQFTAHAPEMEVA